MILTSAPQDEAIMSNVGEIGEFKIRNSAKAFSILSSGLYANKIRAVIRELSCNAVDSHVAAGNTGTPFDVHLPNQLEPWFSIRDYGTGLNHDQVTNIYTTYFESTKTGSNDFIGALGLGSKSPFSYTDNFTVTAIKDGHKGIYTAFINQQGVPSIALMMEEDTDEPNGVEIKFSVEERNDYYKFVDEARHVYRHFSLLPNVSGSHNFEIEKIEYEEKDIVPGIHSLKSGYGQRGRYYTSKSFAVMGNIAYEIEVPNAEKVLGNLKKLLDCGIEIHFDIGELDFQASREGLSYIPETIESIKKKLVLLESQLVIRLTEKADEIDNLWTRTQWLHEKFQWNLWSAAVEKYVQLKKLPTIRFRQGHLEIPMMDFTVPDLASKYNIAISGFEKYTSNDACSTITPTVHNTGGPVDPVTKAYPTISKYHFHLSKNTFFVSGDLPKGNLGRIRYHWRTEIGKKASDYRHDYVYIMEPVDKTKPMLTDNFFKALNGPPADQILVASDMEKPVRKPKAVQRTATILRLERKDTGHRWYSGRDGASLIWREAGVLSAFDAKETYYYMPMKGFSPQSKIEDLSLKDLQRNLVNSGLVPEKFVIHGVRQIDLADVQALTNWINVEDHIAALLGALAQADIDASAIKALDFRLDRCYSMHVVKKLDDPNSPYTALIKKLTGVPSTNYNRNSITWLIETYEADLTFDFDSVAKGIQDEIQAVARRYPLLEALTQYRADEYYPGIIEYVNLIDKSKIETTTTTEVEPEVETTPEPVIETI